MFDFNNSTFGRNFTEKETTRDDLFYPHNFFRSATPEQINIKNTCVPGLHGSFVYPTQTDV